MLLHQLKYLFFLTLSIYTLSVQAQHKKNYPTKKIQYYQNPIIHADYSDPDVIRVDNDYYMVASSFNATPGLPILHSIDLVHWNLITHALPVQIPIHVFDKPQHGNGVWAPSIRYHHNEFYIFYPDPDFGIYLTKASKITGPWSVPVLVEAGKGLIDPCPLWDDDGKVYLVHAYAGSRAGFKSILVIKQLNATADKVIGNTVLVYDGHDIDPTIEGPKLYKQHGYYYIFAPAGGVGTGWQTVLRSTSIYGPYQRKVVMQQGSTNINGPHQGAWVHTASKQDWFIHFQDKGVYGRVVLLQPMQWKNDWPIIGQDADGDGIGEPVQNYTMPKTSNIVIQKKQYFNDECNSNKLGLQWQWQANPKPNWAFCFPAKGVLRLNSIVPPSTAKNIWDVPNVLLQKFCDSSFTATAKITFVPKTVDEKFGLIVMGTNYAAIELVNNADGIYLAYTNCVQADKGKKPTEFIITKLDTASLYLKLYVDSTATCTFSYSLDGQVFTAIDEKFIAMPGKWIGATFGFFCTRKITTNDAGFAEIDWVKINE